MSSRKHKTYRAAAAIGINPYGWGNGRARKKPREVRTQSGICEKNHSSMITYGTKKIKKVI